LFLWPEPQPKSPAPQPKAAPAVPVVVVPAPPTLAPAPRQPTCRPRPLSSARPHDQPPAIPPLVRPSQLQTNLPLAPSGAFPRPVQDVFEAQLALARQGISSGSLDGLIGAQTAPLCALSSGRNICLLPASWIRALGAAVTGRLALYYLHGHRQRFVALAALEPHLARQIQQSALDYETILELVAEKGHSHPNLVRSLNPAVDWTNVREGTTVRLPDVAYADAGGKAAFATIGLSGKVLEAFDSKTNLLAHFPCSIAQHVEKRPVGELHVAVIAPNPNYTFDPDVFPESPKRGS